MIPKSAGLYLVDGGNSASYMPNHLTLESPFYRGSNWVLPAKIDMASGDSLRIEAEITPATIERMKAYGMAMGSRLKKWMSERVTLPKEWQAYGAMGRAAAGVAAATSAHPILNLPQIGDEDNKTHPAYANAHKMLASEGYGAFEALRRHCSGGSVRAELRELMAGACMLGNCCCGKKQINSCYDIGYLMDHPWAAPHHDLACHVTDQQALRSYRAIWE
jgi:hypothetical protein